MKRICNTNSVRFNFMLTLSVSVASFCGYVTTRFVQMSSEIKSCNPRTTEKAKVGL